MIHVLEHLGDPAQGLTRASRTLEPGGFLLVEVPNADSLRARLAHLVGGHERFQAFPIHLQYFNRKTLRTLMERLGFRVVEMRTIGLGLEELFRLRRDVGGASGPEGQEIDEAAAPAPVSRRRSPVLRKAVKEVYSRLGWGEHLFLIAQRPK